MFSYSPAALLTNNTMAKSSEPDLVNFFIFNSDFGPKEGEVSPLQRISCLVLVLPFGSDTSQCIEPQELEN